MRVAIFTKEKTMKMIPNISPATSSSSEIAARKIIKNGKKAKTAPAMIPMNPSTYASVFVFINVSFYFNKVYYTIFLLKFLILKKIQE